MGPDLLNGVFTGCFWFGAAATILSFAFGVGHHVHVHLPGFGHGAHLGGAHGAGPSFSPLNLNSILAFMTVFGAVGLILEGGVAAILAFLIAVLAGVGAGWLVFLFLANFLAKGQTFLTEESLVGTIGTVNRPIGAGRVGEIIYTQHNVRHSDGARSVDGAAIPAGEEVVIVGYRRGIALVQRWQDFLGSAAPNGQLESRNGLNHGDTEDTGTGNKTL